MEKESSLVVQAKNSLWRNPTDEEHLIQMFSESDRVLASVIVGGFVTIQKEMQKVSQMIKEITPNESVAVTSTQLGMFLTMDAYKHLIEDFKLVENSIQYQGVICTPKDSAILQLSIRLEDFFGNKEIPFTTLLLGLKRALLKRDNNLSKLKLLLRDEVINYFKEHKKAKRVKFRFVLDLFSELPEISPDQLKDWMAELGYTAKLDVNRVLWYTK